MSPGKQSPADRRHRLEENRCPIHGIGMGQLDGPWVDPSRRDRDGEYLTYVPVSCPRRDCVVVARAFDADGPADLALEAGISTATLWRLEGGRGSAHRSTIDRLASALGVGRFAGAAWLGYFCSLATMAFRSGLVLVGFMVMVWGGLP